MDWFPTYVPDEGPTDAKILFVGEAPGESEVEQKRPFVGPSGDILLQCLNRNGVLREHIRLANLCHFRPQGNKFEKVVDSTVLQEGLAELHNYIQQTKPTVIVPLGSNPLRYLTGQHSISKWRGSIIPYERDETIKCISTYHPSAVLRDRKLYPIFDTDIKRIIADSAFREFRLPKRTFICDPRGLDLHEWVERLCAADTLACDIETVKKSRIILCVGFALSPDVGVCFVPTHAEGRRAIERVLAAPNKKIFQFGTFDTTQLKLNGYTVSDVSDGKPYYWDTLIAQHVLAPELPRSLEYLTSVYTREPYYKKAGRGNIPDDAKGWSAKFDKNKLYEYNARDCCVTFEVYLHQQREIIGTSYEHTFNFEMSELELTHHISDSGLPLDNGRRYLLEHVLLQKWVIKQDILNKLTGFETNVRSPLLAKILYDKENYGLPARRNRDGRITTDEDAIVSLISFCKDKLDGLKRPDAVLQWKRRLVSCELILEIRGIRQLLSNYILTATKDKTSRAINGRIHSTYKAGATETGRWSAMKYVDGTGFNSQTLPRDPIDVNDEMLALAQEHVAKLESILLNEESNADDETDEEQEAA